MWIVQHWRIIGYCLLGWVILSVLLGIVAGRLIRNRCERDTVIVLPAWFDIRGGGCRDQEWR